MSSYGTCSVMIIIYTLSFFFSALKVLVNLYLFHWPAPSNFAIFQNSLLFLFPSRSFLKSIIHPGPLVCLLLYYTIPVAMTCHELAGLLSSFFQMFACASHVILLMLFCCIASRWLNLYGTHNRFSVYMCHLNCWAVFFLCTILFIATLVIVIQLLSHVWLCDPMDGSTPGLPVPYCLLELAQFHVHWIGDAF